MISCSNNEKNQTPIATKIPKEITSNGNTRVDNYYWLNERENPKVINHLNSENKYVKEKLKHTESLQKQIFDEIVNRIKPDDESVPYLDNKYFYYFRYEPQKEHPIYCRKKNNLTNSEEILLNVNEMAEGFPFFEIGDYSISPNNELMAYSFDDVGRRLNTILVKDLQSNKLFTDKIENTDGTIVWANDNKTFFYALKDEETLREYKICKHTLGTDSKNDIVVYEEKDDEFNTFVYKSKTNKYVVIGSISTTSTEYRLLDADKPNSKFKLFQKREKDLEYSIEHHGDKFYILNNKNAKNFKIDYTEENKTEKENWKEFIPHNKDIFLEEFDVFKNFIVIEERKSGLIYLNIIDLKDNSSHYINFGEEAYEAWLSNNDEFESDVLRYGYSSLTTPNSYFDYNMKTHEKTLLKVQEVLGNFQSSDYETKRLFAKANDGTSVPISIVYRKGIKLDKSNPLLIYGYGAYGYSLDVYFSSSRISLLDRGFVFAIAHVRGGQELGREWYDDGKLLKKLNTFTDFISCTEYLIQQGYSKPNLLFAEGGSAGGLLVAAVANIRPDLYRGIIAEVPFVDVVTTMLDETIPLTTGEYEEWGNPKTKKYYNYMLSYSPYDQIKSQNYPAIMCTSGLHDSQVQYWEPAKWVAKLRDFNTSLQPIYLYTNMDAGHGGASGRFEPYKETAMIYAFMLDILSDDKIQ